MNYLKFSKRFELPTGHECLIILQEQNDDEEYPIDTIIQFKDYRITQSMKFEIEAEQIETFNKLDYDYAMKIYKGGVNVMNNF